MEENNRQTKLPEKRRHSRVGKKFIVRFERLEELHLGKENQFGELIDIGGGGALFRTPERLVENTPLVMTLDLYGWSPEVDCWLDTLQKSEFGVLKLLAMIVRVNPSPDDSTFFNVGVRFSGNIGNIDNIGNSVADATVG